MKEKYLLFKGFGKLGEFDSILLAKQYAATKGKGVYNLREKNGYYSDSWYQI